MTSESPGAPPTPSPEEASVDERPGVCPLSQPLGMPNRMRVMTCSHNISHLVRSPGGDTTSVSQPYQDMVPDLSQTPNLS